MKNSIIYSACGILLKCFNFFLLPLYTAVLSTEDYGITTIVTSFVGTSVYIVGCSLYSAVLRFYVELKNDEQRLKRFYGSVVSFIFLSGIIFFIIFTIAKDILSVYVFSGVDYFPIILLTLVLLIVQCQYMVYEQILKSRQQAFKFAILTVSVFLIMAVCNIVFIVFMKMGATGYVLATLVSHAFGTLVFLIDMIKSKSVHLCIDQQLLKDSLKYSIPIIPHNMSSLLASFISKILISGTQTLSALGIYSIASNFGNIANTMISCVESAYCPWLFEKIGSGEDGYKKTVRTMSGLLTYVLGFLFIGISLFSQDYIFLFIDKKFSGAWIYVPFIVSVFLIKIICTFYIGVLLYNKKASKVVFLSTLSSSLLNIILSAYLIPLYGAFGSIAADLISMSLRAAIAVFITKKHGEQGLRLRDFLIRIIVISVFIAIGILPSFLKYNSGFSILNFLYKCFITILYVLFVLIRYKGSLKTLLLKK